MRRHPKISAARLLVRKVAAVRSAYPAWIDAEQGLSFAATQVMPRVRDGLVLRLVNPKKPGSGRGHSDGLRAR